MAEHFSGEIEGDDGRRIPVAGNWELLVIPGGRDDWEGTLKAISGEWIDTGTYAVRMHDGGIGRIFIRTGGTEVAFHGDGLPPHTD